MQMHVSFDSGAGAVAKIPSSIHSHAVHTFQQRFFALDHKPDHGFELLDVQAGEISDVPERYDHKVTVDIGVPVQYNKETAFAMKNKILSVSVPLPADSAENTSVFRIGISHIIASPGSGKMFHRLPPAPRTE